jgi:hypothetical protein
LKQTLDVELTRKPDDIESPPQDPFWFVAATAAALGVL